MRRILIAAMLLCAMLSGCSRTDSSMQKALDLRTALLKSGGCRFTADVTADYEDHVQNFKLTCVYTQTGGAELTVLQPESLQGIRATVTESCAEVCYEDTVVAFGTLADGNLAPMALPYVLASSWNEGYISAAGREEDSVRITYLLGYGEQELTVDTWLDSQSGLPAYCEISYDGAVLLSAKLEEFDWSQGNNENTQTNMGGDLSGQSGA